MEKINRLIFLFLLTAIVWTTGCVTQKPYPLAGWFPFYGKVDQAVVDDYQSYIQKLSPKERKYMGPTQFFEDGNGQHAVQIESDINGTDAWYHILVYDKENKRTKVIKYFKGHYIS